MRGIRFVQTSDVHLRPDRPERRRALERVFAVARERDADALVIAGDLFDRRTDAVHERAFVRELVETLAPRPVVLVPGNHDGASYKPDADYGANARVLANLPFDSTRIGELEIIGLPYQHSRTAAECLSGLASEPGETVLVAHGTLAMGAAAAFVGDDEDGAYMPIFPADLERRFCYAALGHLHSGTNLLLAAQRRLFAYAGSPVATSRREIGRRGVLVVDVEPGRGVVAHELVALATPYYERVESVCTPGSESAALAALGRAALRVRRPGARVLCRLSGVTTLGEASLRDTASAALERAWSGIGAVGSLPRPVAAIDDDSDSFPILELAVTSYAGLARMPIVTEFVERLEASATAGADPKLLETALRLGLGAFLEVLP